MTVLTQSQIEQYHRDGYCSPINILSEQEAEGYKKKLEKCESEYPELIHEQKRNNTHHIFTFMDEIVFHPRIIDAVKQLLGPNLLLYGSVLFIKDPQSKGYVSWHQDATYMGLYPHDYVTPWLALTPSNSTNGCMSVIPGSHLDTIQPHEDTFEDDNILTRGQKISDIDESKAVDIILEPGQLSLHHPRLIHGSKPNRSAERRIGIALQCYMKPNVDQIIGKGYALHISGEDPFSHFALGSRPQADAMPECVKWRDKVEQAWSDILYAGAKQKRNY